MNRFSSTYVEITEDEMKDFLKRMSRDITFYPILLKPGTTGVYFLPFSENVALSIATSVGSRGSVVDRGKGAIRLSLTSLKTKKPLAIKAMEKYIGKTRINRTLGWERNLETAIKLALRAYREKKEFFEQMATGEKPTSNSQEWLEKIEAFPGWESNNFMSSLHEQILDGRILSTKQIEALERSLKRESTVSREIDQNLYQNLRQLYRDAREANDQRSMDFLVSVGTQVKEGKILSKNQLDWIEKIRETLHGSRVKKIASAWVNRDGHIRFTSEK